MGAKESKTSCINYDDAVRRVSEAELKRLEEAFKKSAGTDRPYLSRKAFQNDVLSEGVPANVADLLYTTCGGTDKGISFKDLLCGLVLITKGSQEEKTRFLWNLYCNDSGTHILRNEFIKFISMYEHECVTLFAYTDRVNFEQFESWILANRNATSLSKWLLSDNSISLTSQLETPTFYQSLAGVTHLEEQDIGNLEKEFWRLKNTSPNGQLDLQLLGPLLSPPIPKHAIQGLFNAFDENRDGHIDFKELCCGVSAACRGPKVERTRFCFKIFDVDRDGVLNQDEVSQMINVLLFVANENRNANFYKFLTKFEALKDIDNFVVQKETRIVNPDFEATIIQDSVKCAQSSPNHILTVEDFMMWNVESTLKLLQPFLDLIFEVCHIVFGLWPQCRHMEYDIVRGWLDREEKRKYRVGQIWYLISRDWWLSWLQYTDTNSSTNCDLCKRSSNVQRNSNSNSNCGIDEALVCDESFNTNSTESVGDTSLNTDSCSLASASSGISTGHNIGSRPGPIDNTSLILPNPYKGIRTLTDEGGHLKRDTPLVQNHDFELVPKSLWKALNRWYYDNLPLPRQVIKPPDSSQVELELYPINLRILLHQNAYNNHLNHSWGALSENYGALSSGGAFAALSANNALQIPKRYLAYTAAFSHLATVQQVSLFLCEQLGLHFEDIRLWHIPAGSIDNSAFLLEEDSLTLTEISVKDNDQLLLEIRNKDQTWPEELCSLTLNSNSNICGNNRRLTRTSIMSLQVAGATGLQNLGNTCFMNAALQVLFNTQPLAQYFRQNMHLFEINTGNRLGTRGHLAMRYGELLKEVWVANTRSVAPLKLRFCITKHAPQFAGGGQHDSQELLEWFLDALHEDLNRVTDKPYSELKDSNDRPDKIVAAEAWSQHNARNQSIIIDLFYGQLKSKVSCLCCGHESVRFDPFSLLSLPLPVENFIYFEILLILLDGSVPIKYGLRLNSESKYYDLKLQLASLCYLNPNLMLICEVYNSQIRQIFKDVDRIRPTASKDLYAYQLPEEHLQAARTVSTFVINIEKGLKDIQRKSTALSGQDPNSHSTQLSNGNAMMASNIDPGACNANASTALTTSTAVSSSPQPISVHSYKGDVHSLKSFSMDLLMTPSVANSPVTITESPKLPTSNLSQLPPARNATPPALLYANFPEATDSNRRIEKSSADFGTRKLVIETNDDYEEDDDRDNNSQVATKQTFNTNRSCEDAFNNGNAEKRISASKLLSTLAGDKQTSVDEAVNSCNEQAIRESQRCLNDYGTVKADEEDNTSSMQSYLADSGNCIFSRVPSQYFKVGKYLFAVHRKITRHDSYFLSHHKTRPVIFGQPLIIPHVDGCTQKDLYCTVWLQVSRLLSPLPVTTDQANHAADCDDSLGYDFPFSLRAVKNDGLTCAICPWTNFCRGCEIPCNNDTLLQGYLFNPGPNSSKFARNSKAAKFLTTTSSNCNTDNQDCLPLSAFKFTAESVSLAIDWDPTALHLRYQSTLERLWMEHESVAQLRKEQNEPVDLDYCLKAFTSEEKLEQCYHCSHCNGKKPATKKLQIWKLPPILIIHLKRFNCVNGKWMKSQKVVHFPFDDFDPTPYLAAVPQETILRNKELLEMKKQSPNIVAEESDSLDVVTSEPQSFRTNCLNEHQLESNTMSISSIWQDSRLPLEADDRINNNETESTLTYSREEISNSRHFVHTDQPAGPNTTSTSDVNGMMIRRQRLISTSLTKTPIIDGAFEDFHQHKLKDNEDKFDPKYKLYAVVSHSGMLNGGHYISYAANPNGNWYCYNDSSCREISIQPNIDASSAYLLFYERKGLDYQPYLPNINGKSIPSNGLSILENDDSENELKKLCTIS